jgi:S1-C subfamily serine protease
LVGDVLLDVAGEPLDDPTSLRDVLAQAVSPGGAVRLLVMRGGETLEVEVGFGRPQARGA